MDSPTLASSDDLGSLGVPHLKRFWSRHLCALPPTNDEWDLDNTLLSGLRLPLRETVQYLHAERPSFDEFETRILSINAGKLDPFRTSQLVRALRGDPDSELSDEERNTFPFDADDLAFWQQNGYVVLREAVSKQACADAANAIYDLLNMDPDRPDTWYGGPQGHSIWIPLLHHPAFWANREAPRVRAAFQQLWGRKDMWTTVDQGGMNPPERDDWRFPGPYMHWDVSLVKPVPFGLQGILYLTDTDEDQGAFQCVPGFQHKLDAWLDTLPPNADPNKQDLESLGPKPIPGKAGDLVIWHHALPHGASPNRSTKPRVVQYMFMRPTRWEYRTEWR